MSTTKSFNFFIPAELSKADDDGKRWIQGIASTPHIDLQGEKVMQKGIDFEYFLSKGFINDDHKDGPEHKVGEPTECKMTKDGLWIKGFLYKGKERADFWWEHLKAIAANDSNRKVGFSIQGKVQMRKGNVIEKCWLQDVAITASPVNTHTWAEIVKSLSSCDWEEKALAAGDSQMLIPESLEGEDKEQTYKGLSQIPDGTLISREQSIAALQIEKGWSRATAEVVVDAYLIEKGIC